MAKNERSLLVVIGVIIAVLLTAKAVVDALPPIEAPDFVMMLFALASIIYYQLEGVNCTNSDKWLTNQSVLQLEWYILRNLRQLNWRSCMKRN